MSSVTRLHDSGGQGQPATGLAFAKPSGAPLGASSVSSISSGLRVSRWAFTTAGAVSLANSALWNDPVSQFDAALISGTVVVAYRAAANGALNVLSFNPNDTLSVPRPAIGDQRLAVVRRSADPQWFVALANVSGDLRAELWQFTGPGNDPLPQFVSDSGGQAGAASHIAGAFASGCLVTAVRTGGGTLKLISWGLDPQNGVQRLGDSGNQAGAVEELCLGSFSPLDNVAGRFVVTAVKNGAGNLEIISWRVGNNGSVTRLASLVSGPVGELAITAFQDVTASNLGVFVTATTNGSGDLQITSWRLLADGSIQQLAANAAGVASHVSILDISDDMVATTCVSGNGTEKLITWRISQDPVLP
jgi:hypothetical protein